MLALQNVRGFSRRLTIVIVPLALALATGTVQSSVDAAVGAAGREQLRAAVTADLVVTGGAADRIAGIAVVPGVSEAVAVTDVPVQVRTDEDDLPDSLVWESTALRVVPADLRPTLFDPGVTRGRLAGLSAPGTVAVSSDAAFELGLGPGDPVDVRAGGREHRLRVVAVFDRGLGVGGYLTGPTTARALGVVATGSTTLVATSGRAATVADRLRGLGLTVSTPEQYADSAVGAEAAAQHLSTVLLLLLLVFVGLGAGTALVLTTAGRRAELALLQRSGTTRGQLLGMTLVESLLTGGLAWIVGTAAVVPAVLGVSLGLLGWHVPVVDLTTYAVLSAVVVLTSVACTVVPAAVTVRRRGAVG